MNGNAITVKSVVFKDEVTVALVTKTDDPYRPSIRTR